ncbi:hypothetical protein EVAR_73701_1 [Eumeta japonica]|uniref:Uncharacterized protein n=1 Tax=Eumeta variegata TaxID=151549 RepID=A0A4C1TJN8_EUMVA|nr:hypothetical protein EVAR_73701_1 [Eumeta japonica]
MVTPAAQAPPLIDVEVSRLEYRYYNSRLGLEEQSYSTAINLLSSEDSVRHYQTEALLGLYNPKAERQGVAHHQDQTCSWKPH